MSKKIKSKKRTKKVTSAPKAVKPEVAIPVPDSVKTDYPLSVYDESIYPSTSESKPGKKPGFWKWLVG
jgi:hypothetical protein